MGTKEDQIMDAKTEKAAKDVKKRETEENKGFREKLIEKIMPEFLKKQKEKNKALKDVEKGMKYGGKVHKMKKGGKVRGDGICKQGKTKGRMV